jgi:hypothetical protein
MGAVYKMDTIDPDGHDPEIIVVETEPEHVRYLGANLRDREIQLGSKVGFPAHRALWRIYKKSIICKTVFVNGMVVAIFGLTGSIMGKTGRPWFVACPFVEGYPLKLAFRYRSEVKNMLKYFPVLEDYVDINDEKTIRLLGLIGFKFEKQNRAVGQANFVRATLVR